MANPEWPKMRVSGIEWKPDDYILTGMDYIMGMLLEMPEMYYIIPDRTIAYIYVIGRGLVVLHHDFTFMDEKMADLFVYQFRKSYSIF